LQAGVGVDCDCEACFVSALLESFVPFSLQPSVFSLNPFSLPMHTLPLTPATHAACLRQAAELLLAGGVVVIPTDTVYGLAAHPAHPAALLRLYTIKGRLESKPIALLAANAAAAQQFGAQFPPAATQLAANFWPGALTLVLACENGQQEGFRVPAHDWTRALLTACGGVLRVTSANLSGAMPAVNAVAALQSVGLEADLVIDDGTSPGGVASTVVRVKAEKVEILRPGAIEKKAIAAVVQGSGFRVQVEHLPDAQEPTADSPHPHSPSTFHPEP
jgi:L-threonylcarbamoyladenylate synthase